MNIEQTVYANNQHGNKQLLNLGRLAGIALNSGKTAASLKVAMCVPNARQLQVWTDEKRQA
jgi:hypothetical protein